MRTRCEYPGCRRTDIKARGMCGKCYHREWRRARDETAQRATPGQAKLDFFEERRAHQIRLLEKAYRNATNVKAALRMRDCLEQLRRNAAN